MPVPTANVINGADISSVLTRGAPTPHEALYLFNDEEVVAVRTQRWKYLGKSYYHGFLTPMEGRGWPQLYDMTSDISESYSAAERNPQAVAQMQALLADARKRFAPLRTANPASIFGSLIPSAATGTAPAKQD